MTAYFVYRTPDFFLSDGPHPFRCLMFVWRGYCVVYRVVDALHLGM